MPRARTIIDDIAADHMAALDVLRAHIMATGNEATLEAWASVETFSAIALRVIAKTNPSKVRDEAMKVEIASLLEK